MTAADEMSAIDQLGQAAEAAWGQLLLAVAAAEAAGEAGSRSLHQAALLLLEQRSEAHWQAVRRLREAKGE